MSWITIQPSSFSASSIPVYKSHKCNCFIQILPTGGDPDNMFTIGRDTGSIMVARPLDAEQKSLYNLTISVTDGVHAVSTQVRQLLCLVTLEKFNEIWSIYFPSWISLYSNIIISNLISSVNLRILVNNNASLYCNFHCIQYL